MRCTYPRTVGFRADGKTISWSQKTFSKEFATFQLPCGKCIECRLEYARTWAIRCVHEAQMHEENCFITLTYSDEHLSSPILQYRDFQLFMKRLRFAYPNKQIGVFVTGEYGEENKRPHWHAILFGWRPSDLHYFRSNDRGDDLFTSATLDALWGKNDPERRPNEVGDVTFHSAGYCARYAAKKLVHGKDGEHSFQPISKKSCKHAIGKRWLELHWRDLLSDGQVRLRDGTTAPIPRYYTKWLLQNEPAAYFEFLADVKDKKIKAAMAASARDSEFRKTRVTRNDARREIQKQKFDYLQSKLKL